MTNICILFFDVQIYVCAYVTRILTIYTYRCINWNLNFCCSNFDVISIRIIIHVVNSLGQLKVIKFWQSNAGWRKRFWKSKNGMIKNSKKYQILYSALYNISRGKRSRSNHLNFLSSPHKMTNWPLNTA